jgi:hypothetical protein
VVGPRVDDLVSVLAQPDAVSRLAGDTAWRCCSRGGHLRRDVGRLAHARDRHPPALGARACAATSWCAGCGHAAAVARAGRPVGWARGARCCSGEAGDPLALGAAAVLAVVSVVALIPARRASRVDPVIALTEE